MNPGPDICVHPPAALTASYRQCPCSSLAFRADFLALERHVDDSAPSLPNPHYVGPYFGRRTPANVAGQSRSSAHRSALGRGGATVSGRSWPGLASRSRNVKVTGRYCGTVGAPKREDRIDRSVVLALLGESETTVTGLAAVLGVSRQAVQYHLRVLRRAGLVARLERGPRSRWRTVDVTPRGPSAD